MMLIGVYVTFIFFSYELISIMFFFLMMPLKLYEKQESINIYITLYDYQYNIHVNNIYEDFYVKLEMI